MFERFTEGARQAVVLAQDEARLLKHNYIGTEHLLLGLLRVEDGLAAQVLESLGVNEENVRAEVARIVGQGDDDVVSGQIPFTPRAKKVLDLSLREALSLGHDYIGTEHLLLGVVRENDGVAARILLDFGADPETIRGAVTREPEGPARPGADRAGPRVAIAARRRFGRTPRRVATYRDPPARRDWLPVVASGVWALFGLAVGVLLGRATRPPERDDRRQSPFRGSTRRRRTAVR